MLSSCQIYSSSHLKNVNRKQHGQLAHRFQRQHQRIHQFSTAVTIASIRDAFTHDFPTIISLLVYQAVLKRVSIKFCRWVFFLTFPINHYDFTVSKKYLIHPLYFCFSPQGQKICIFFVTYQLKFPYLAIDLSFVLIIFSTYVK